MFLIFMIHFKTKDTDVYYLNLEDEYLETEEDSYSSKIKNELQNEKKLEKYVEFKYNDYRITDMINTIRNNGYIYIDNRKQTIQNALIKADLTTIWIGMNDFEYGLLKEEKEEIYNYMDTLLLDIDTLLTEIRTYTKEEVFFISSYTTDETKKIFVEYLNNKVEKLCEEKEIHFVRIDSYNSEADSKTLHQEIAESVLQKFTFS